MPQTHSPVPTATAAAVTNPEADAGTAQSDWYLLVAAVNTYPKLESEELVEKFFNKPLSLLAPGFDDVQTFSDVRDAGLMWPPHVGAGKVLNDRWGMFFQTGYSAGKVRTKATDPSLLLLPLHTDFEVQRKAFYAGLGLDFYPWRTAKLGEYDGVKERLRAARPFLGSRLTVTHATYDAKIKVGFKPLNTLVELKPANDWLIPSLNFCAGADVPLSRQSMLTFNAGYNFFADRQFDFGGTAFTLGWKRFFR